MAIIRVSGHPGAGKTTICKLLSETLGYEYVYTGGALREMAKERGMPIEDFYRELSKDLNLEKTLDAKSEKLMQSRDNVIVEGRVAPFQKAAFSTVNILLTVTPREGALRQSLRSENKGKSVAEIERLTVERIGNERAHYQALYSIEDHFDPKKFDIVVDTTNLSVGETFDLVLGKVKKLL